MRNITEYLLSESTDWHCKYIQKPELIKFAKQVIKDNNLSVNNILAELSEYEDPDELDKAWEDERLTEYKKFEDALAMVLADNDKYGGKEGDIMDYVWGCAYDFLSQLK